MRNSNKLLSLVLASALLAGLPGALATAAVTTLHIEVLEDDEVKLRMEMPVAIIEAAANSFHIPDFDHMEIFEELEDEGIDVRSFWEQVREMHINEFFTLTSEDADIRAWREDGLFRLSIDAHDRHEGAQVEIRIPEALMDIIVEDDNLQPGDLIEALQDFGPMTLVEVETDDGESVRVWMD